jgi:hypothetical protein
MTNERQIEENLIKQLKELKYKYRPEYLKELGLKTI